MNRADTAALKSAMLVAADAIIDAEPELTRIDKVIGDGDHGIGMKTPPSGGSWKRRIILPPMICSMPVDSAW